MATLEKAYFVNKLTGSQIDVMFNPAELSVKKTVPWNQMSKPGKDQPKQQFTSGQARSISLKLDFDTSGIDGDESDAKSVLDWVDPILVLANVPVDNDKAYPPLLDFGWGSGLKFTCVMKSVNVTYTRFNPDGVPTRANVQVELLEVDPFDYIESAASQGQQVEIRETQDPGPGNRQSPQRD